MPLYTLEAATADLLPVSTTRQFEQWTLTCITATGIVNQQGVSVERGQKVDVGDVCKAGLVIPGKQPPRRSSSRSADARAGAPCPGHR